MKNPRGAWGSARLSFEVFGRVFLSIVQVIVHLGGPDTFLVFVFS